MKKSTLLLLLVGSLVAGAASFAHAQFSGPYRATRIDVGAFYEDFSTGGDEYGPWWGTRVKMTNRPALNPLGFTGILEAVVQRREDQGHEADGVYVVGSAYYDWSASVYSFSSFGMSSGEPFVQLSAHQEVAYKVPPHRDLVLSLGGGYLDYHTVNRNAYATVGGAYYWNGQFESDPTTVLEYRYRRSFAQPADDQVNAHVLTVGFGSSLRWTTLRYLYGQEIVRAGGGLVPVFDTPLHGQAFAVEHEMRLSERYGVAGGVNLTQKTHDVEKRTLFSGVGVEMRFFWNL